MFLQKFWNLLSCLLVLVCLNACSSAVFPEVIEDDSLSDSVLEEDDALASDTENASYEGEDDDVFADVTAEEKIVDEPKKETPAVVTPIKVAELPQPEVKHSSDEVNADESENEPSVTYRLETIYFDNGSAEVASEYKAKIREAVRLVKNNNAKIRVLGFSSSRTRNMDVASHKLANFKISAERAENVANALRKAGVPADSITTEALSDSAPAYLEVMPEGERLNRRAEIYVSY